MRDALAYVEARCGVRRHRRDAARRSPSTSRRSRRIRGDMRAARLAGRRDRRRRPTARSRSRSCCMLWLANGNPAFAPYERAVRRRAAARRHRLRRRDRGPRTRTSRRSPASARTAHDLITLLRAPALAAPDSLAGQLRWIRERWGFAARAVRRPAGRRLDVLAEEERAVWMRFDATQGGGAEDAGTGARARRCAADGWSARAPAADAEVERFSPDLDWMPRVVLIAKSDLRLARPALARLRPADRAARPDPRRGARPARARAASPACG